MVCISEMEFVHTTNGTLVRPHLLFGRFGFTRTDQVPVASDPRVNGLTVMVYVGHRTWMVKTIHNGTFLIDAPLFVPEGRGEVLTRFYVRYEIDGTIRVYLPDDDLDRELARRLEDRRRLINSIVFDE